MEINYQISQWNKNFPIDPVFSNWVNLNKKVSIIVCSTIKSFKVIFFSSKIKSWRYFWRKKTCQFLFQFHCDHYSFPISICQLAMFYCFEFTRKLPFRIWDYRFNWWNDFVLLPCLIGYALVVLEKVVADGIFESLTVCVSFSTFLENFPANS